MHNCPRPPGPYPAGSPGSAQFLVGPVRNPELPSNQPSQSDIGAFRAVCSYSHMNYDDPLVFPGQTGAAHLHTSFGNTGTNAHSTYDSLRTTGNSTCNGGIANRTAYWIPSLLANGVPLAPTFSIFYYKGGYGIDNVPPQIQHIPNGLRMIAGNAATTELQTDLRAHWTCRENSHVVGHHPQIVDCPANDDIQLSVYFPQCWNGVDLDSPDHKSHMAYPVDRACPSSHPVVLPEVSFNVFWPRSSFDTVAELRLSSDCIPELPGGYSAHGDWFEAWEPEIRDAFVDHCLRNSLDCHGHLLGDGRELYEP